MPFLIQTTRRVDGLVGSPLARFENIDNSGPYKAVGGEPMFGSGSYAGSRPNTGGGDQACGGDETTGMASGGSNTAGTSMAANQINSCAPPTQKPSATPNSPYGPQPPCLTRCCGSFSGSGPGGFGSGPGGFGSGPSAGPGPTPNLGGGGSYA